MYKKEKQIGLFNSKGGMNSIINNNVISFVWVKEFRVNWVMFVN